MLFLRKLRAKDKLLAKAIKFLQNLCDECAEFFRVVYKPIRRYGDNWPKMVYKAIMAKLA